MSSKNTDFSYLYNLTVAILTILFILYIKRNLSIHNTQKISTKIENLLQNKMGGNEKTIKKRSIISFLDLIHANKSHNKYIE